MPFAGALSAFGCAATFWVSACVAPAARLATAAEAIEEGDGDGAEQRLVGGLRFEI